MVQKAMVLLGIGKSEVMTYFMKQDDVGFDLEKAKKCVETYSRAVGVNCIIIDAQGETLYDTDGGGGACRFCKRIQSISKNRLSCPKVHLYGSYQAERFGGKYIFFCPMGLVHWASPLFAEGMMRGAVLGGPVLMVEPEEFLMDDIIRKNNIAEKEIEGLKQYTGDIPVIQPEIVSELSELLFMVAAHISGVQSSQYVEKRALHRQQSNISEYIHDMKKKDGTENARSGYPLEKERELLTLISMGDKAGSQKILNEILGYIFFSTGRNFDVIKARVLELVVLLSRAALEGGADAEQIFGLNYQYLNQIDGFEAVEELAYWLSKIMVRFTDCVFNFTDVKHVDVIYKAVDYVKRNYMKKLSLEEAASHVFLSPSYFSKVFKEEMKVNFSAYLNRIRIEMSKKLLLDDDIALVDISNLVGFEDQSYFSKVFKRITGLSPGKFRESRGKLKAADMPEG